MIPPGTFQCALCENRYGLSKKKEAYRSYIPERKIVLCESCYDDYRKKPEYSHLRPDSDIEERQKIEERREYQKETHIYF